MWAANIPAKLASAAVSTALHAAPAQSVSLARISSVNDLHKKRVGQDCCNAQVLALATDVPLLGLQHVKRVRKPPQAKGGAAGSPQLQILLCRAAPAGEHSPAPQLVFDTVQLGCTGANAPETASSAAASAEPDHRCLRLLYNHRIALHTSAGPPCDCSTIACDSIPPVQCLIRCNWTVQTALSPHPD